jgi:hypothetical protein
MSSDNDVPDQINDDNNNNNNNSNNISIFVIYIYQPIICIGFLEVCKHCMFVSELLKFFP